MSNTAGVSGCVGRETELRRLGELYAAGRSQLAILSGPRGAGKSALLRALGARTRLEGGVVLEGRCAPGRPFAPFAEIVEGALRFLDQVGVAPRGRLEDLACEAGCHRLWFEHNQCSHASGAPEPDDGRSGERARERRFRFFEAIRWLLQDVAAIRKPVILLHHLEQADRESVRLLEHLLEACAELSGESNHPMLLAASVHSDGAREHASLEALMARAEELPLSRLDAAGVRAFLQSPRAVAKVLARTGGLPEAIEMLLEADPLTPEALLERRLAELPASASRLLKALAVLQGQADADQLARAAGVVLDARARAAFTSSELLSRTLSKGRMLFSFSRSSLLEHAYANLEPRERTELHGRWAEIFASEAGEIERAAHHAIAARMPERAVPLALDASRSLAARHAHAEAAALLERVLTITDAPTALTLLEPLVDLYRISGDYRRAIVHAGALAEAAPESTEASRRFGHLLTLAGRLDEAAAELARARALAIAERRLEPESRAEALLAELAYQRARYDEALAWARSCLETAIELEDLPIQLHARNTLGKLALARQDAASAAELFEENRALASEEGLWHEHAQALTNLGIAMLRMRDFAGAERAFEQGVKVAQAASDTRDLAIATENLAVLAHLRREYDTALLRYREAMALLNGLGNRAMLSRVANNLGELHLSLGERVRARSLCEFAAQLGGAELPASIVGEGLLLRGRVERSDGNSGAARAALETALGIFEGLGEARILDASIELLHAELMDGDVSAARSLMASLPETQSPRREADLALIAVDIARLAGEPTGLKARRALDRARALGDDEALLMALLRLTEALLDEGDLEGAASALIGAQEAEGRLAARVPAEALESFASRRERRTLLRLESRLAAAPRLHSRPPPRLSSLPPAKTRSTREAERLRALFPRIIGSSPATLRVLSMLEKVAPTDTLTLLRGESGTGKELLAEALHENSSRRDRPFVKVNCAALVETLLLSELFGHERGAFTGAAARRKGRFELAEGGTIFLDEIGDISQKTQVALLRVLQEREIERVGGTQSIPIDVRIIVATHRDLEAMVAEGSFREDLYYRLRGVTLEMPPLRERREEIPELCEHLLARIAAERDESSKRLSAEATTLLERHRWPGNVRELENVLRSASLFAETPTLMAEDFTFFARQPGPLGAAERAPSSPELEALEPEAGERGATDLEAAAYQKIRSGEHSLAAMKRALERECIVRALAETEGNITRAAELLGMKRPRLSQLVKQFELQSSFRRSE